MQRNEIENGSSNIKNPSTKNIPATNASSALK